MPSVAPIQSSFNAGEFSPLTYGRVDFPKYKNGVTLCQNFIPLVQGPVTRRPGGKFIAPVKEGGAARLISFVFSTGDAFMIEFGDEYLRFYRNRAPVFLPAQDITGISNANPAIVSYDDTLGDTYSNGDEILISDVVGMETLNGRRLLVANVDTGANTFEVTDLAGAGVDSSSFGTYSSAGIVEKVYEIVSPFAIADVPFLRVLQSRDVLYIAHPSYAPRKLSRSGLTSWAFATVDFKDGPYMKLNSGDTTLTPGSTTGTGVTVTASAVDDINSGDGFLSTDIGRKIRIKHSTTWGWATVVTVTSTTVITVDIDPDAPFGGTGAVKTWRLGEWSETTGFPSIVFTFEDRVGWGASPVAPVTLNMSTTDDYENMAPTATDSVVVADNALQLKANQKRQDPIRWVFDDEKGLVCGTKGNEFLARSSTTGLAMSAENLPSLRRSTKWGSSTVEPVEVGKAVLFAQTSKRKLRELAFVFEVDGFRAPDMTVLATHSTESGIAEMAYQQSPHSIVWVRREDGQLWGMTYEREQDVIGWHRHRLGGYSDAAQTAAPLVESVETMPSPDGFQDDLWIITNRYINGQTERYVEYLTDFNENYAGVEDCFFVDSGVTVAPSSPTSTIIGLDHLEGQVVSLLVDGKPTPDKTVSGGAITSDIEVQSKVHVGLNFKSRLKTLRIEAGSATGTAQGKLKRTHKLSGRFHQTANVWVGREFDSQYAPMDVVDFRPGNHRMGAAVPFFTGDKVLDFEGNYDFDGFLCLETRQPLPCTLVALMPQLKVEDGL